MAESDTSAAEDGGYASGRCRWNSSYHFLASTRSKVTNSASSGAR